ncbi:MAG: DUF721 domain-containing protein [Nitrospiraceae bacterium]|nr:DUF721 domain-containing protein [Nitrospiraceae bacterium]
MEKAGSLLGPVLRQLGIETGVRLEQMKREWHTLFDKPLSAHMSPGRLSEGELLLFVDSPIWIQQLTYYRKEITGKLARYGVKDVKFLLGRVTRPRQVPDAPAPLPPLSPEESEFVERLEQAAGNRELGRAVKAAAERSIRAKKKSGRAPLR